MNVPKNLGIKVLGGWLVLTGVIPLVHLSFSGMDTLMAIGALAAGVLIILGR